MSPRLESHLQRGSPEAIGDAVDGCKAVGIITKNERRPISILLDGPIPKGEGGPWATARSRCGTSDPSDFYEGRHQGRKEADVSEKPLEDLA